MLKNIFMERLITELIDGCLQQFKDNHYSRLSLDNYRSLLERGIHQYMKDKGLRMYSCDVGKMFLQECYPETDLRPTAKDMTRCIKYLDDYMKYGYIRYKTPCLPQPVELSGEIGNAMSAHLVHLKNIRRSKRTIDCYKLHYKRFLFYLTQTGIHSINEIKEQHIIGFISTMVNYKANIVSYLRVLFIFWHERGIAQYNLTNSLQYYKVHKKEIIVSYYNRDEIRSLESSVDRASGIGKRNYALLLLASRLGLRVSDIANLKFSNIDWENNTITLYQYKTRVPLELPLLSDIGNAIIDYLKYGRQKSNSQYVFLNSLPPYSELSTSGVTNVIRKIFTESGVLLKGRHHGPHSLRHSLASRLLEKETSMPIISEVLGHEKTETTLKYLQIDLTALRKCVLPVPPVSPIFYSQKRKYYEEF